MELTEKLSFQDRLAIGGFIRAYGEDCNPMQESASLDYILRFWSKNKNFLYKLLGNNLIIEKEISYTKREGEIDFYSLSYTSFMCQITICARTKTIYIFDDKRNPVSTYNPDNWWYSNPLKDFFYTTQYMYENKYTDTTFYLSRDPNKLEDALKIQQGCKWSKMVVKIGKYLGIEDDIIEDWRKKHSLLLNQKTVKGILHLSIHPLDYMTMSEGTFTSCMSWSETGQYRSGTIEMMNSPSILVAYITSKKEKLRFDGEEWNCKIWRSLVFCNTEYIETIKGYPYTNETIAKEIIDWIKDLGKKNLDINYCSDISSTDGKILTFFEEDEFTPTTGLELFTGGTMYPDIGTTTHWGAAARTMKSYIDHIDYCGELVCMNCGEKYSYFDEEERVFCPNCYEDDREICGCCGERISDIDSAVWLERTGCYYCEGCAENLTYCPSCSDYVLTEDSKEVVFHLEDECCLDEFYRVSLCPDCFEDFKNKLTTLCETTDAVSSTDTYDGINVNINAHVSNPEIKELLQKVGVYNTYDIYGFSREKKLELFKQWGYTLSSWEVA